MRNTHAALVWIVGLLHDLKIPFEIDGGFAAAFYGSKRELADIDINVPAERLGEITERVKDYLTFGPDWYRDEQWDLYMISLNYAGQNIDIGALGQMKYYDKGEDKWKEISSDMNDCRTVEYEGMNLPLVNEIKLMIYKQGLQRGVDKKDLHSMTDQLKNEWTGDQKKWK